VEQANTSIKMQSTRGRTVGVAGRGDYYDKFVGCLRDMVQKPPDATVVFDCDGNPPRGFDARPRCAMKSSKGIRALDPFAYRITFALDSISRGRGRRGRDNRGTVPPL